jgi:hypothetical protein
MGATEEQIAVLAHLGVTHVSYILLIFSASFLLFLFVNVLLHIYTQSAMPIDGKRGDVTGPEGGIRLPASPADPRHQRTRQRDAARAKAAEEFELEGLISEEEEEEDQGQSSSRDAESEDSGSGRRKENGRI